MFKNLPRRLWLANSIVGGFCALTCLLFIRMLMGSHIFDSVVGLKEFGGEDILKFFLFYTAGFLSVLVFFPPMFKALSRAMNATSPKRYFSFLTQALSFGPATSFVAGAVCSIPFFWVEKYTDIFTLIFGPFYAGLAISITSLPVSVLLGSILVLLNIRAIERMQKARKES